MKSNSFETITYPPEHPYEKYYSLKEGDVYVEAGALVGRYGVIATRKNCSRIILIEPSPESADVLQSGIDHGLLSKNTTLVRKAISNEKGKGQFSIYGDYAGHRLDEHGEISVFTDTLDNILTELRVDHVDLLSCDCEGCEYNLVKSAEKYFNEGRIKNVALATYHVESPIVTAIEDYLKKFGFIDVVTEIGMTFGRLR